MWTASHNKFQLLITPYLQFFSYCVKTSCWQELLLEYTEAHLIENPALLLYVESLTSVFLLLQADKGAKSISCSSFTFFSNIIWIKWCLWICVWNQVEKITVLPKYIHEDVIALSECDPIKIPEPCQSRGMSECLTHISHLVMDSLLLSIMSHGEVDQ